MKVIKFIKRFFLILFLLSTISVGTSVLLTYIYSDEIKQWTISQINSYFNTEIKIGQIDFSIFKNFPDATIILTDVIIKSSKTYNKKDFKINSDTLLKARSVFLQFNLIDIIQKKYTLQTIKLNDASILLCYDKKGQHNFSIIKENREKTAEDETLNIKLDKIKLRKTTVSLYNAAKRLAVEANTNDFSLSGDFYKNTYNVHTNGQINLKQLIVDKVNYLKANEAKVNFNIKVSNNEFEIKKGVIKVGKIALSINGNYQIQEKNDNINIQIEGRKQSLGDLIESLPETYLSHFKNVKSSGFIDFSIQIHGGISYKVSPRIKASFTLNEGSMINKKSNTELNKITVKGTFDNGIKQNLETSTLKIDTFYTQFGDSSFFGQFSIFNFSTPLVKLKLQGFINLEWWKSLLNLDIFKTLKGNLQLSLNYSGKLKSFANVTASDYRNAIVKGNMHINNAAIQLENNPTEIQNINGKIRFQNNDVFAENLTFELNQSQVILKGLLQNAIAYIMLPNEKMEVQANLNINKVNVENWQNTSSEKKSNFYFPTDINFKGDINIDEFTYNKFTAKKLTGLFELLNGNLYFSNLQFTALEGNGQIKGRMLVNSKKEILFQSEFLLQNINIKKLFHSFDNFGQDFITEKHFQGKLNATVPYMQIKWDSTFTSLEKDILLDANIEITNGQLIEFEPIYKLADYIDLNELRHVKFSTLKNDISIKERKIIIPNMEVKTNAFSIEVSGEHSFDNNMEYHIKLLLREWLAKKAKKNKKENEEFGIEENDGLGSTALYLIIKANNNKYQISYDSKKMKEQAKESLKQEKQEIKTILHQEFGLFKKDSSLKNTKQTEPKKTKFKIVWDEDNPEQDKSE